MRQAYRSWTGFKDWFDMPRVEINMVEGDHSRSQKLAFMKKATEAVVNVLGCAPSDVRVTILEYARENVSRAGVSVLESG